MSDQDFLFKKPTLYPFNHVYQSESGHFVEFDDNKGSERITLNHRSGSHIEFHPNADFTQTILGSKFSSVYADECTHVWGAKTITVNRELKLIVSAETLEKENEENSYNLDVEVGKGSNLNIIIRKGNCNIILEEGDVNLLSKKGDMKIRQDDGNYFHYVNGNYRLHVTGQMDTVVEGNQISLIKGSRSTFINGKLDFLNMTNSESYLETRAYKESRLLYSDFYISSKNFVSRAEDQTIMETGANNIGEFTITSAGNINITSGWDPKLRAKSQHPEPRLNLFSYKRSPRGGDVCIFTDNDFNLVSENLTKFDVRGGTFHIKSEIIRTDARDESNPASALEQEFPKIHTVNYSKINYDAIMSNGFEQITIAEINI